MRLEPKQVVSVSRRKGPVDLFEASYHVDSSLEQWLEGVVAAAGALERSLGIVGLLQRFNGASIETVHVALHGEVAEGLLRHMSAFELPLEHLAVGPLTRSGSVRGELGELGAKAFESLVGLGIRDAAAHMARHEGDFLTLIAPSGELVAPRAAERRRAQRVTTHLATGLRLRARIASGEAIPELVLSPGGRVEHIETTALGGEPTAGVLEQVKRGVQAVEKARGPLRNDEPERATSLWRALVEGRWSLAERVERNGRRFILAFRNELGAAGPSVLGPRERDVVAWAAGGASLKEIGYAVGLGTSTVGEHLANAMRKLKVETRAELAVLWSKLQANEPGHGLAVVGVEASDVFARHDDPRVTGLSEAERDVARRAALGESSARIAAARGTSVSTVTNQLGAIFRKLGVASRAELSAWVAGQSESSWPRR